MTGDTDQVDAIEACRTCGIYYMSTTNYLQPLFQEYPEMMLIRLELSQWKLEIRENDGLPQYVCNSCIHEFQKVFKFRASCTDTQEQLRVFYNLREENLANIKIKTEAPDLDENDISQCNFIYVDDLSDGEYDSITPFHIPHIPIKEEKIEEATVPRENGTEAVCLAESASVGISISAAADSAFDQHFAEQHETAQIPPSAPPKTVECELCQHLSSDQEEHTQHLRRVHELRDIECHICGKVFKNSTTSRFKFHLKWHNINKHVKCTQCGFVCNSSQALKEHKRAIHAKITCKICGKVIIAKKMKRHLRSHQDRPKKFPCEYCTQTFQLEEEREAHIWKTHANDDDDSNAIKSPNESLSEHHQNSNNIVSEEVILIELLCAHCDQKFVHQSDLEKHAKEVHCDREQKQESVTNYERSHDFNIRSEGIAMQHGIQDTENEEKEEEEDNDITIFEDYDDGEEDEEEHLQLSNDSQYISKFIANDNCSTHFQHFQNFTQYRSSGSDDKLNDDEVTIEHLYSQQQEATINEESMDRMETSSAQESESDTNSNISFIVQDITLPFACAKCIDTFATIEQLRLHYQQHQEQAEEKPSNKSKFSCNICDKEFDLKFSLNRHMKKHNNST